MNNKCRHFVNIAAWLTVTGAWGGTVALILIAAFENGGWYSVGVVAWVIMLLASLPAAAYLMEGRR